MMLMSTYMKVVTKHYQGQCAVIGCEKWVCMEDLVTSFMIGMNSYFVCLDHGKDWFEGKLKGEQIDMMKYARYPTKEEIKRYMLEAIDIIKEALQE